MEGVTDQPLMIMNRASHSLTTWRASALSNVLLLLSSFWSTCLNCCILSAVLSACKARIGATTGNELEHCQLGTCFAQTSRGDLFPDRH